MIHGVNQATIIIEKDTGYGGLLSHIETHNFGIQDVVRRREVAILYCTSQQNSSDIRTTPLLPPAHMDVKKHMLMM